MGIAIIIVIVGIIAVFVGISLRDVEGWIFSLFGLALVVVAIIVAFFGASPIDTATDIVVGTEECKLATLDTHDGSECYVLRNSQGMYYFVTEVEDQFGKGHSAYKEKWIDGDDVLIIEDETSSDRAYVVIDKLDARMTFESCGFQPVKCYTFVVPKGTIQFTRQLPGKQE